MTNGHWRLAQVICALTALTSACGSNSRTSQSPPPPQIRLAANPWSGSEVDAAVAKILLETQLGFAADIVQIDENTQWADIADGTIHGCLEVWPSGHTTDIHTYIDQEHRVENGGPLGVVGKIGWYIPTYVLTAHPTLATWEGFKDPGIVALFRTPASGDKGQFLTGDPTWVQYDQQIIDNLGLEFQVVVAGSESAMLAQVDTAYGMQAPILFYFWTPHAAHQRYALTEVQLPPYSAACYAQAATGGIDCDYPSDQLIKILWSGLEAYAPKAHQFLRNFNYSTDEQTRLIAMVDLDHMTPTEAARSWIAQRPEVWRPWIPSGP